MTRAPDIKLDTYTTNRSSMTETDRIHTTQQLRLQSRDARDRKPRYYASAAMIMIMIIPIFIIEIVHLVQQR